jgi:hypothetical protein
VLLLRGESLQEEAAAEQCDAEGGQCREIERGMGALRLAAEGVNKFVDAVGVVPCGEDDAIWDGGIAGYNDGDDVERFKRREARGHFRVEGGYHDLPPVWRLETFGRT